MKIINNNLVFKHPDPDSIPLPKKLAQGWVAVPHTLHASHVLRSMGLDAPSPISTEYEWQGKYTPFQHQRHTAEFLTLNKRAFVLSGMGSMKTCSTLWAADYLKQIGVINRVLIVSPLSTLDVVWGREIFTNFPTRTYNVLHGTGDKRRKLLAEVKDFYILNPAGISVLKDDLEKRTDIDLIIIDEMAEGFRNSQNSVHKSLRKIIKPSTWVWGMSGTPTPQGPTDAYGLAKLIKPENVPFSFTKFKSDVMMQCGPFKWIVRKNAEYHVNKILSPSICYQLRDCVDLPETITQYRQVDMTSEQTQHYNKLLKECVTEINGNNVNAVNAAALFTKLIQVASGVVYGEGDTVLKMDFSHRLSEIEELCEECNEKIIVFAEYTNFLLELHKQLSKKFACELMYGDVPKSRRAEIFDRIQYGDSKVLVACPSTMAHGINLNAASTIVWAQPTSKNGVYSQANARIVRPGQKNITNLIHVFASKEEQKIYSGLQDKNRFQDIVLSLAK